ncbi:hypothetical protein Cs7R123_32080 [Catellatospora sp. TT07R-123]|uniref:hypothetical protein n=1 Tax=Catellatospora sp. TT07R-123 TaxID=2733863 RepID=UPI001B1F2F96|nr:hypothetical protein [Catellatospora sp. TT07R-123]GHJ45866.1 hypothetical protein Cs7R123_32080 [Catellatospora sp. TT07R-123]
MNVDALPALREFVTAVAELTTDVDPSDNDGPDAAMDNDIAWETLHRLVHQARELVRDADSAPLNVTFVRDWSSDSPLSGCEPPVIVVPVVGGENSLAAFEQASALGQEHYRADLDGGDFDSETYGVAAFSGDVSPYLTGVHTVIRH